MGRFSPPNLSRSFSRPPIAEPPAVSTWAAIDCTIKVAASFLSISSSEKRMRRVLLGLRGHGLGNLVACHGAEAPLALHLDREVRGMAFDFYKSRQVSRVFMVALHLEGFPREEGREERDEMRSSTQTIRMKVLGSEADEETIFLIWHLPTNSIW
ncbi:hypothetical protein R1flu_013973 [Riccia fluitans]|uniref:Uncharacterized protein n=1 Tax=Riccia fluitans TaxID=41844 RepID=A0ABD1YII0_9MARC